MMFNNLPPAEKAAADVASVSLVIATLFQWLPQATALLSFVWICIRIFETETVRGLVARFRRRRDDDK